ncbi:MAG: PqqD family protein [Nitrospinota bacterium]
MAEGICEKYDADPERVFRDVRNILDQFRDKKLLRR